MRADRGRDLMTVHADLLPYARRHGDDAALGPSAAPVRCVAGVAGVTTPEEHESARVLGSLRAEDGRGVVRLEDRVRAAPDDVWTALTGRDRLAVLLGEVDGDLREGGELRARFVATGWEGVVRVRECRPGERLVVETSTPDQPGGRFEISLDVEGECTHLVVEDHGVPLDQVAAYAAGDQVHVEDLVSHLGGGERCDARARFEVLHPLYQRLGLLG